MKTENPLIERLNYPTTGAIERGEGEAIVEIPAKSNFDRFIDTLESAYRDLFENDPDYSYSASRCTPRGLAEKMTLSLRAGTGNKDGEGVKRACRAFGLKHTYKDISAFLS